ncbi:hypothetical protein FEK33_17395 [Nocardia asteroides NBRC 15531]|uniref:Cyanobacterial TRADD-N associated 2 transmembrane domain-containing protein n=1 Tax=Nocardia asteroides NBRC 15531 TaxID=1110697 RepID=U5EA99_NOCAS|nr:hypothetical protein [Nocardia asteroides]TLF67686.1 hypothetical protein FEK33_17395 [Nocardia asteroides NBRC 15531]UGT50751.1 hypothetical protein LT345_09505 [Nocardia asteroides]SFN82113.1 hypothetical protein SAMN05444423_11530 [Nocardia asteroides]VEG36406.1 Uncharacterised protein [Nocardia asteroides]GAD83403.1 hypothetical protein NCAST_19_01050 [Nocardia asteroides NBRC 15531]
MLYLGVSGDNDAGTAVTIAIGLVMATTATTFITRLYFGGPRSHFSAEFLDATENVDRAVEKVAGPNDLLKLMEVNRRQMEAYDVQARAQGRSSHRSSLFAMTAGLAIVGAGLWIAVSAENSATKYAAAIVAAVGTATGGYIAHTFISVNTSAQHHVRYYFEQPLVQSYLLTAERIADRLPESARGAQYELIVDAALQQAGLVHQLRDAAAAPPEPEREPDPAEGPPSDGGESSRDAGKE